MLLEKRKYAVEPGSKESGSLRSGCRLFGTFVNNIGEKALKMK
jgi:hypothetical protein